jgi:hypothetical protein
MEKEFDFKNIGKQMPYRTPDGFFDRMQEQVSARTKVEKHKKQLRMRLVIGFLSCRYSGSGTSIFQLFTCGNRY